MHIRRTSLIFAVVIVVAAMAGTTGLHDYRQYPWILINAVTLPAQLIVLATFGGPFEANGFELANREPYVGVAIFLISTLMWYGLIEGTRRLLRIPQKPRR